MNVVQPSRSTDHHAHLTKLAADWLSSCAKCRIIMREIKTWAPELPDAIGWVDGDVSIKVECKVSRSDFFADRKKNCFKTGMGDWRFYLVPEELVTVDDLPDNWGLLFACSEGVRAVHGVPDGFLWRNWPAGPPFFKTSNKRSEITMLNSFIRRSGASGVICI